MPGFFSFGGTTIASASLTMPFLIHVQGMATGTAGTVLVPLNVTGQIQVVCSPGAFGPMPPGYASGHVFTQLDTSGNVVGRDRSCGAVDFCPYRRFNEGGFGSG